jgi:hypothetical protein
MEVRFRCGLRVTTLAPGECHWRVGHRTVEGEHELVPLTQHTDSAGSRGQPTTDPRRRRTTFMHTAHIGKYLLRMRDMGKSGVGASQTRGVLERGKRYAPVPTLVGSYGGSIFRSSCGSYALQPLGQLQAMPRKRMDCVNERLGRGRIERQQLVWADARELVREARQILAQAGAV